MVYEMVHESLYEWLFERTENEFGNLEGHAHLGTKQRKLIVWSRLTALSRSSLLQGQPMEKMGKTIKINENIPKIKKNCLKAN